MTETEAREQLGRVFDVYPTFRTELSRCNDGAATGTNWARMLLHCDLDDVRSVVDQIVSGEREAYGRFEKWDSLPRTIRTAANEIRSRRNAREKQQKKYHDACNDLRATDKKIGRYWRLAMSLGECVKFGLMTTEENNEMMSALREWYLRDAEFPAWVPAVIDERRRASAA